MQNTNSNFIRQNVSKNWEQLGQTIGFTFPK
jgi:hypothetical protein